MLKSSTEDKAWRIDFTPLFKDKDVREIIMIHTHPVGAIHKKEGAGRERRSKFPLIPSGIDLVSAMIDQLRLREYGSRRRAMRHMAIEPSGSWTYEADLEHPRLKRFSLSEMNTETIPKVVSTREVLVMALGVEMEEQQEKIHREGGISEKNLRELQDRMKKEWGITFDYQPFE